MARTIESSLTEIMSRSLIGLTIVCNDSMGDADYTLVRSAHTRESTLHVSRRLFDRLVLALRSPSSRSEVVLVDPPHIVTPSSWRSSWRAPEKRTPRKIVL